MTQTSTPTAAASTGGGRPAVRGLRTPLHPSVLGSVIGAVGASAFVLVNRGALPEPWRVAAAVLWALGLLGYTWVVLVRRRPVPSLSEPHRLAGLVYVGAVAGMLALMSGGRLLLVELGRPDLQPAVVVLAVGLHFVPFAWAFRAPVFTSLGLVLAGIGGCGLLAGWVLGATVAGAAAVLAGFAMMGLVVRDQLRSV